MAIDLSEQLAFPRLNDEQLAALRPLARQESLADGASLFNVGERDFDFFVILDGEVDIIDVAGDEPRVIVTHGPGHFTGDVSLLNRQPSVVSAIARGDCQVLRVPAEGIRQVLGHVPALSELLLDAFQMRRSILEASGFVGIRVYGPSHSPPTLEIREFLYKNKFPFTFVDTEEQEGLAALQALGHQAEEAPVLRCSKGTFPKPSLTVLAEHLGIARHIPETVYDMTVIGAGPAGLAAAVYAASEGLKTLIIDRVGPGGQAGTSSRIENYMGFPSGLSGAELANRGFLQALKFGADFTAPVSVLRLHGEPTGERLLDLCTGQQVRTRSVLLATGVTYRRLEAEGCRKFEGAGVYYSATSVEARGCQGKAVAVVGGGNSAGQAALFLAQHGCCVHLMIRGNDLNAKMSHYLTQRIELDPNIEILTHTEVAVTHGDHCLQEITVHHRQHRQTRTMPCTGLFVFVGAHPGTDWLPQSIARDRRGFILCGPEAAATGQWPLDRPPCPVETSMPGVFAAGDVRSGSTKRVAFAVGDGAFAVACAHQVLAELATSKI